MAECALTTLDNPFNPLLDFEHWLQFDIQKGYGTIELLGRITRTSDSLSDEENDEAIETAIDEIVDNDITGLYIKVTE